MRCQNLWGRQEGRPNTGCQKSNFCMSRADIRALWHLIGNGAALLQATSSWKPGWGSHVSAIDYLKIDFMSSGTATYRKRPKNQNLYQVNLSLKGASSQSF